MKFNTETKTFSAVATAALSYSQKAAFYITTGMISIETGDNVVTLRTTNNKTNFLCTVPADITEPGRVFVSTEKLAGILSNISAENVSVENVNSKLYIKPLEGRKTKVSLACRETVDFPPEKVCADDKYVSVPGEAIANALTHVMFFTAKSAVGPRATFSGVNVEQISKDGKVYLTFTATDGRALATETVEIGSEIPELIKAILPLEVINKMLPLLRREGSKIAFYDGSVFIENGVLKVNGLLLSGNYPNWRRVLPQIDGVDVKVNGAELAETLGLTSVLVEEKSRKTALEFFGDKIVVHSSSPELGEAEQEIDAQSSLTQEFKANLSEQLLNPIIATLKNTDINIKVFPDTVLPLLFTAESIPNLTYCIMPMQS